MSTHTATTPDELIHSLIHLFTLDGTSIGTAFVLAPGLAVTCAHVARGEARLRARFAVDGSEQDAEVTAYDHKDVAFLHIATMPSIARAVVLGSATGRAGHAYHAPGYAPLGDAEMRVAHDHIGGLVAPETSLLQIEGDKIAKGLSGAPVLDTDRGRVIGMITRCRDDTNERFAYAIPADTLVALHATLRLWPDTYGPNERDAYLKHLCDNFGTLTLLGGEKIPLEQLYISLRADQMNTTERRAERFYLEDLAQAFTSRGEATDPYTIHNAIRRAVAHTPTSQMLTARHWDTLFGTREKSIYSLAEIVQRHPHVVILGDPGSGKTTLGKWLVLQHARALLAGVPRVQVRVGLVYPGTDAEKIVDLGPPCLPIFVRIAEYVKRHWDPVRSDFTRSLIHYLGEHIDAVRLPHDITSANVYALTQDALTQGTALVILDGLDEVGNSDQRRAVMQAIKALQETNQFQFPITFPISFGVKNLLLLTSRIVGYQFHPLTDLPHFTVEEMDAPAIGAFCHAWVTHIAHEADTPEQATRLQAAILEHAHPGVRTLAGNPLLLTILAQIYFANPARALPTQRVALFDEAVRAFYTQRRAHWEANAVLLDTLTERVIRPLGAVAVHLQGEETSGFTDEGSLRARLAEAGLNTVEVATILSEARDVTGFLVARGEGVYAFIHRALQEYCAAHWLVRNPARVTLELVTRALNPTWREPLVLAVGLIGRPEYPDHSRHLPAVLATLLDAPDPAGKFIPRRELLVIAACAECLHLPPDAEPVVMRAAENLLVLYADHEGRTQSSVIRERIERAFSTLRASDPRSERIAEKVLISALNTGDFEHRSAAADILFELQWHTPALAHALLTAWHKYPDPAATLLAALESHFNDRPQDFTQRDLPMRHALHRNPIIWQHLQVDITGQSVLQMLYMEVGAPFAPESIMRDSPLTEALLNFLSQNPSATDWHSWATDTLFSLASATGTAIARDAALALSALGDAHWIEVALDERALHAILPITAILARTLARTLANAHSKTLDLERTLDLNDAIASARDTVQNHVNTRDLVSGLDYVTDHHLDRNPARAGSRTNTDDVEIAKELDEYLIAIESHVTAISMHNATMAEDATLQEITQRAAKVKHEILRIRTLLNLPAFHIYEKLLTAIAQATSSASSSQAASMTLPNELTTQSLPELLAALAQLDDAQRDYARKALQKDRSASIVGHIVIEHMAHATNTHRANPQVGMHCEWALHHIQHDTPGWIMQWIARLAEQPDAIAERILRNIFSITEDAFPAMLSALPHSETRVNIAMLTSLGWLERRGAIPNAHRASTRTHLLAWLANAPAGETRVALLTVLGHWRGDEINTAAHLFAHMNTLTRADEQKACYHAIARLAKRKPMLTKRASSALRAALPAPDAASALARIATQFVHTQSILAALHPDLPISDSLLHALLDAGVDDDNWNDAYHGLLVQTVYAHLAEARPEPEAKALLTSLVTRFAESMSVETHGWPARRIALAALAASIERMPAATQQAARESDIALEPLLVRAAADIGSFNVRRHALTALSYLRAVNTDVARALLAGCQDEESVQTDTLAAAARFRRIDGDPLPMLMPALTGPSVRTAHAVARLFGVLGANVAGAELRERMVDSLTKALSDESCRRIGPWEFEDSPPAPLADTFYEALLQVVGWLA